MSDATFHESWYRIAAQRVSLRRSVKVQRQFYGGEKWHVLWDPIAHQFYRLRPGTYRFVARLSSDRTVEEVWKEAIERDPENAPGQGEVIELLSQLYHANLLHYHLPPNSLKLFERHRKKKRQILQANLMNIMFFRIPLFDPDRLLQRLQPVLDRVLTKVGAVVWVGVVLSALKLAVDHWGELRVQSQGILAPSNLFLLYVGVIFIKTLHEFGHAAVVRRFGGEVHVMGVMFLIFSPLPYMDASAAWSFRNRWHRVLVGAAGMISEVFVAALAMFVWANAGPGTLHSLAYNMMFVASVSTLLFNINPLLRFDGYYILSDLTDTPNLHQQSTSHMKYLLERHAFGLPDAETPATSQKVGAWLATFGILSGIYKVVVFGGILLFIADRFLLLGMIMAVVCFMGWVATPLVKFVKYVTTDPRLYRVRSRALQVSAGTTVALVLLLGVLPFPYYFKAPGVLKAQNFVVTVNQVAGDVAEVVTPSGTRVKAGEPLLRLQNPELESKLQESRAGLQEAQVLHQKAMQEHQADLAPIASRIDYFSKRVSRLEGEKAQLVVTSESDGLWVAPDAEDTKGMWLPRGTPLGQLVDDSTFTFVSVVPQQNASTLFSKDVRRAEVKLIGQAGIRIPVRTIQAIPMEQTNLPSPALGWGGGGDVAIDTKDNRGMKTAEPYYQVRATVSKETAAALLHGRSGRIRFTLPARPLAWQAWLKLRQLVQKRYLV